jgi:hypothetical protein
MKFLIGGVLNKILPGIFYGGVSVVLGISGLCFLKRSVTGPFHRRFAHQWLGVLCLMTTFMVPVSYMAALCDEDMREYRLKRDSYLVRDTN